jgi:hypothetical protein
MASRSHFMPSPDALAVMLCVVLKYDTKHADEEGSHAGTTRI